MRIQVRDVTNTTHEAEVASVAETDARSRALIDGVQVLSGEWLAPQGIVGIKVLDEAIPYA